MHVHFIIAGFGCKANTLRRGQSGQTRIVQKDTHLNLHKLLLLPVGHQKQKQNAARLA
jgi:hypothetical protein